MEDSFSILIYEVESSKDLRTCIEKLITIFRNIVHNPEAGKYRSLRTANKTFNESVWKYDGSKQFMQNCGWIVEGESVVLPQDTNLTVPLNFLIENRDVKPCAKEWVEETKHIIPNEAKEKEQQLRQEAMVQKEKEMIELKKDMAEREAIKARILAEHRHDKEKRKVPVGGSSKDLNQAAPVVAPQRFSSSNVLGSSRGPGAPPLPDTGAHTTAHRRASAFPRPTTQLVQPYYPQPAMNSHHPPTFGAARHTGGAGCYPVGSGRNQYPASYGSGGHAVGTGGNRYPASYGSGGHAVGTGGNRYPASYGSGGHAVGTGGNRYPASYGSGGHAVGTGGNRYPASNGSGGHAVGTGGNRYSASYGSDGHAAMTGDYPVGSGSGQYPSSHGGGVQIVGGVIYPSTSHRTDSSDASRWPQHDVAEDGPLSLGRGAAFGRNHGVKQEYGDDYD